MGFESRMEGSGMTHRSGFYLHTPRSTGVFWVVYSIDMMLHDDIVAAGTYIQMLRIQYSQYIILMSRLWVLYEIILI